MPFKRAIENTQSSFAQSVLHELHDNSHAQNWNWTPVSDFVPEFADTILDTPDEVVNQQYFNAFVRKVNDEAFLHNLLLAHKVISSGVHNRFGCRIPVKSCWIIELMHSLLADYHDKEVPEWLTFGFPISRPLNIQDPTPAEVNHRGTTRFEDHINDYINSELKLDAMMGPFSIPPFLSRIGILPLSSRPKKE